MHQSVCIFLRSMGRCIRILHRHKLISHGCFNSFNHISALPQYTKKNDMLVFPQYVTTLNNGASLSNQVPTQSNKIHLAQEYLEKSLLLPKNKISILEAVRYKWTGRYRRETQIFRPDQLPQNKLILWNKMY